MSEIKVEATPPIERLTKRLEEACEIMRAAPIRSDADGYFEKWHAKANSFLSAPPPADSPVVDTHTTDCNLLTGSGQCSCDGLTAESAVAATIQVSRGSRPDGASTTSADATTNPRRPEVREPALSPVAPGPLDVEARLKKLERWREESSLDERLAALEGVPAPPPAPVVEPVVDIMAALKTALAPKPKQPEAAEAGQHVFVASGCVLRGCDHDHCARRQTGISGLCGLSVAHPIHAMPKAGK